MLHKNTKDLETLIETLFKGRATIIFISLILYKLTE